MFTRFKMNRALKKIKTIKFTTNQTFINSFDAEILEILHQQGCIDLLYADNRIYAISYNPQGTIYTLSRRELWVNRIVSYIAGILSTFITSGIINHVF